MISIRGINVHVDVLEELQPFDLEKTELYGDELKACSPIRDERKPSFYINTETGLWKDFGAENDALSQGNLIQLLSILYKMEYEEAEEFLLDKYNINYQDIESLELKMNLQLDEKEEVTFSIDDIRPYLFRNKQYLLNRGISEEIQAKFVIGYCKENKAVAFFWRDSITGKVVTIKFRNIHEKKFYYKRGGQPVNKHIFGLYDVIQDNHKKVYVVESEIDALYLWTNNIPAVALGGSSLSEAQERLLKLSGIETIVIASDSDKAGYRLRQSIIKRMGGSTLIKTITLPEYAGDINDVRKEDIKTVTSTETPVTVNIDLQLTL